MAIELWELHQRQQGNHEAADAARALREKYGDVPYEEPIVSSPRLFTGEQRSKLQEWHYEVYRLTGKTIRQMIGEQPDVLEQRIAYYFHDPSAKRSQLGEVAITPWFLLSRSNNKSLQKQREQLAVFSDALNLRLGGGIEAIIGDAPDYLEVILKMREAHGDLDFFPQGSNIRTATPDHRRRRENIIISRTGDSRINSDFLFDRTRWDRTFIAPLIVPAQVSTVDDAIE